MVDSVTPVLRKRRTTNPLCGFGVVFLNTIASPTKQKRYFLRSTKSIEWGMVDSGPIPNPLHGFGVVFLNTTATLTKQKTDP